MAEDHPVVAVQRQAVREVGVDLDGERLDVDLDAGLAQLLVVAHLQHRRAGPGAGRRPEGEAGAADGIRRPGGAGENDVRQESGVGVARHGGVQGVARQRTVAPVPGENGDVHLVAGRQDHVPTVLVGRPAQADAHLGVRPLPHRLVAAGAGVVAGAGEVHLGLAAGAGAEAFLAPLGKGPVIPRPLQFKICTLVSIPNIRFRFAKRLPRLRQSLVAPRPVRRQPGAVDQQAGEVNFRVGQGAEAVGREKPLDGGASASSPAARSRTRAARLRPDAPEVARRAPQCIRW